MSVGCLFAGEEIAIEASWPLFCTTQLTARSTDNLDGLAIASGFCATEVFFCFRARFLYFYERFPVFVSGIFSAPCHENLLFVLRLFENTRLNIDIFIPFANTFILL